ncbi:unnamed protein product [Periconia digitata]|uniref:Uncharacterized protein n=1 Tax=Periconia digitata TaxID=1303443 RepID=A0A9W4U2L4_9PLEO|nr:unnamed protein product [Periconia digitata]
MAPSSPLCFLLDRIPFLTHPPSIYLSFSSFRLPTSTRRCRVQAVTTHPQHAKDPPSFDTSLGTCRGHELPPGIICLYMISHPPPACNLHDNGPMRPKWVKSTRATRCRGK